MKYILYNPLSGHGNSYELARNFAEKHQDASLVNMTAVPNYETFFSSLKPEDDIYIFGGDGSLNRFINALSDKEINVPVYYYPSGTGNDFCIDIGNGGTEEPFLINSYLTNLPVVTVNGMEHRFINGVGFGLDGYACQVGDAMKAKGKTPNYTKIAIMGILWRFNPVNARVTVDGVTTEYSKVWIAPTMFGRHYGGGMMPTPAQDRYAENREVSLMVFHGSSRLKTLMTIPMVFKGEHVKKKKIVSVMKGKEITVEFDRPTALQIDGETILGVTKYSVTADAKVKVN